MAQPRTKVENKTVTWSARLRPRVTDTVSHNGVKYINITGGNGEPGVSGDWERSSGEAVGVSESYVNQKALEAENNAKAYADSLSTGGGSGITRVYTTISAMLADQNSQFELDVFRVNDASEDPTVTSGRAYYDYIGTESGTIDDYYKISEEESMDLDLDYEARISELEAESVDYESRITVLEGKTVSWQPFTGDGVQTSFTVSGSVVLVEIDGRIQKAVTDYTVSYETLTFTEAPYDGASIQVLKGSLSVLRNNATGIVNEGNVFRPNLLDSDTPQEIANKINAAIASAAPLFGLVILPAGVFKTRTIEWDPRVYLKGQGKKATILISTAAEPLINYTGDPLYNPSANISNMALFGGEDQNNKIGTVGLNLQRIAFFNHSELHIMFFAQHAGYFTGVLIGHFTGVDVQWCGAGFKAIRSSTGSYSSNLITFRNCTFSTVNSWPLDWDHAASLQIKECDFEACGTSQSGLIRLTDFCPSAEGVGLVLDGSWGEYNQGTLISIQGNAAAIHTIRNTMFQYNNTGIVSLQLNGGKALMIGSTLPNPITIINGELETLASVYGAVTLQNASTHKIYTPV